MVALAETAPSDLADELTAPAVASSETADHFTFPFPYRVFRDFFPADSKFAPAATRCPPPTT
jgi:hypothetical protein